jgi:hypothetical protein
MLAPLTFCGVLLTAGPLASRAEARLEGFPVAGCDGCHKGARNPMVNMTADPARIDPGGSTTLTIHIEASAGPTGGFYLTSYGKGMFTDIPGQSTRRVSATEEVHSAPRTAVGGEVTFQVRWTAPAMRGGVDFDVWAVSANGSRSSGGDGQGQARFNFSFGCEGVNAFIDMDKDGYGVTGFGPTRVCEIGPGYSLMGGDCNDYNANVHPGATEVCNVHDDNCDGKTNEGFETLMVYRDEDGDGYGGRFTTDTRVGCGSGYGYSPTHDDCDDDDREIHPGATEACNNKDDNCNGRIDDGARAACGVGWCRRLSPTCDPAACVPGNPRAEMCNYFDDDCDGMIDNGPNLCANGQTCYQGMCLGKEEAASMAAMAAAQAAAHPEPGPDGGPAATTPPPNNSGPAPAPGTGTKPPAAGNTVSDPRQAQAQGCALVAWRSGGLRRAGGLGALGLLAGLLLVARRRT